ncbi:R3H domain-containing protein 1 [Linnemannia zychae]|nr:R3H domain-containing protein 1 [Linnemannia zychae]
MAENTGDKTEDQPSSVQAKVLSILKPTPLHTQEPTSTLGNDNSVAQDPITKLTKSLEGVDIDEDSNDAQDMALDEFLVNALKNRQERIFLLKLDREFCSFINNPSQPQLEFPTLNGYYRMMVHKVANYFKLTRIVDQSQKIILFKTESSAIPPLRISDLAEEEDEQPVKMMKVLKRNPDRVSSGSVTPDGTSEPERKPMSIKEREEAYARARARIFQEDIPAKSKSPNEGADPITSPDASLSTTTGIDSQRRESNDDISQNKNTRSTNGKKLGSGSRYVDEQEDREGRQPSLPGSRDASRSTSPSSSVAMSSSDLSTRHTGKGLRPKAKQSKTDLAAECVDVRRRKSNTSNASSSPGTVKTPVGLARTISSSSSQDGFQSPSPGMPLTESPSVNSPSSATPSKGYDYFAPNPNSNSGSVSPMSNGHRSSYTIPQPSGHKQQHRNYNSHSGHNGGGSSGIGYSNNAQSNPGFMKGMNAPVFVPKKPYPKHGQAINHQNLNSYNNGSMSSYQTGPPNLSQTFSNNNNNNTSINNTSLYTQQPSHNSNNSASPWPERGGPSGQDGPNFYIQPDTMHGSPSQPSSQGFNYPNAPNQFSQPGPSVYTNQHQYHQHHPSNNHSNNHHHISHRGGRRGQSSQPYYQHHSHARTHPQLHNSQQQHPSHHGGNFNGPSLRDDFTYNQVPQTSMRYNRGYDGNLNHPSQPQFTPEFYPSHSMSDSSNGSNIYSGYQSHQTPSSEATQSGQRYPYNHKGPHDANWSQGPIHPAGQGYDQSNTMYNLPTQAGQGGKKPYNKGYHSVPPINQQQFLSTIGSPQNVIPGMGPGSIGGNGTIPHYDIERRPPKSAELFDPNGPQPSSSSGGGSQGDYGNSGRHQGSVDGGYMSGQEGSMGGSDRQPQGHRGSLQGQYQSQPVLHYNQAISQPTHTPIAMNRSFSSSSSAGYSGGNTSSPGPHAGKKNHNLIYDYSVSNMPYEGNIKSTSTDTEKAPALGHILEIFGYDAQDNIFPDLALPAGSKMRQLKATSKDAPGQVLVVFKNAILASEALCAFQEGKSTWVSSESKLHFETAMSAGKDSQSVDSSKKGVQEVEGGNSPELTTESITEHTTRIQQRFNVRIWTPVLVNSVTPLKAVQPQLSSSPSNDLTSSSNSANTSSNNISGTVRLDNSNDKDNEDGGDSTLAKDPETVTLDESP